MAEFNKEKYWERRNEGRKSTGKPGQGLVETGGKRGQGDKLPKHSGVFFPGGGTYRKKKD